MKIKNWKYYSRNQKAYILVIFALLAAILSNIRFLIPAFDGAMNLIPAKNLAVYGEYYSFYFRSAFPYPIQTRFFLQLPAALFIKIFGLKNWSLLLCSALTTFIFFFLSFKLSNKLLGKEEDHINYFTIPLLLISPMLIYTGLMGYGELIAYCFVIAASIIWINSQYQNKKNNFFAFLIMGILFGCAIITKTIALLILPAFVIALSIYSIWWKTDIKTFVSRLLKVALCFSMVVLTFAAYEAFRYYHSDKNYLPIFEKQANGILIQAGLLKSESWELKKLDRVESQKKASDSKKEKTVNNRPPDKEINNIDQRISHLKIMAEMLNAPPVIILLYFFFPACLLLYFIYKSKIDKEQALILIFFITIIFIYFFWWIFLAPTIKIDHIGKYRRLVPAFALNAILCSYLLHKVFTDFNLKIYVKSFIGFISIATFVWLFAFNQESFKRIYNNAFADFGKSELIQYINQLPEQAEIYGMSFKHAPQILLFVDKKFKNIHNFEFQQLINKEDQYFILDPYAIDSKSFEVFLQILNYKIVAQHQHMGILIKILGPKYNYEYLKYLSPDSCLENEEIENYQMKSGFYPNKDIIQNWTTKSFNVSLMPGNFNKMDIEFSIPHETKYYSKKKDHNLDVYVNSNYITSTPVKNGKNRYSVYLPEKYLNSNKDNDFSFRLNTFNRNYKAKFIGIMLNQICLSDSRNENFIKQKNKHLISSEPGIIKNAGITKENNIWIIADNLSLFSRLYINDIPYETIYNKTKKSYTATLKEQAIDAAKIEIYFIDHKNNTCSNKFLVKSLRLRSD